MSTHTTGPWHFDERQAGTGDTAAICSGVVRLVSTARAPGGEPSEIVVEYDDKLHVRHACQSWEQWYATAQDAYRAGVSHLSKTIADANKAMLSLVDSHAKAVAK
jgi:hypothetical protein